MCEYLNMQDTLHIATYNMTSEIFDTREEAQAFAAEMNDDKQPFKTSIREIDFDEAFVVCSKGRTAYFGKKWDGQNKNMKIEITEKIETLEDELQTLDSCSESDIDRINEIKQEIAQLCADIATEA